jgi:AcrR family transcriptional regulator
MKLSELRSPQSVQARNLPQQARALKRHEQILDITAEILEQVGFDDLTTIRIASRLGISVGSLYHYFPNKIAILFALSQRWLDEITRALDDMDESMEEGETLERFVDHSTDRLLDAYRRQHGILHLVQAMFAVPELRDLDEQHDELMADRLGKMFIRLGFSSDKNELSRIAHLYIELVHALALVIVNQKGIRATRTITDLKAIIHTLLSSHL